ncbi:MAG: UDP-N-acetylmuramoyl-L-alanyl-D-glutamate--2,6-diaminopimelate ligase [Saprospiraceae bacterium]
MILKSGLSFSTFLNLNFKLFICETLSLSKILKSLENILTDLSISEAFGDLGVLVNEIQFDSRKVKPGSCFFAVKGLHTDGHRYIDQAVAAGAKVIICETLPTEIAGSVTFVKVPDSAEALGKAATNFYDHPSAGLRLVGITGTNGKTTTATLLHQLFTTMGYKVGLLSTVENKIGEKVLPSEFTTPDAISLNALLAEMKNAGCDYVFMEVSSHAIEQRRIAGVSFVGGVFTNITHDHLDYHKTFKAYINVKKRFFDDLPKASFALTNIDDRRGTVMVQNTKARVSKYSLHTLTDFKAKVLDNSLTGLHLELDGEEFFSRLIGEFNAYNLLAVYATARLLGAEKLETMTALSGLKSAEGRFDYIFDKKRNVIAIVDYAHTPDALEKVLSTIEKLKRGKEQVITVIGCGGDRDKSKRPLMAEKACEYSSQIILTSDNPRSENAETIISEMEAGIPAYASHKVLSITNRLQAIKTACKIAKSGDIILVAGKGHEKYQEINGIKNPFDDKKILLENLNIED